MDSFDIKTQCVAAGGLFAPAPGGLIVGLPPLWTRADYCITFSPLGHGLIGGYRTLHGCVIKQHNIRSFALSLSLSLSHLYASATLFITRSLPLSTGQRFLE